MPTVEMVLTIRLVKMLFPILYPESLLGTGCSVWFFSWITTMYSAAKVVYAMMTEYVTIVPRNIRRAPCGRFPMLRMNCRQISSTHAYRSTAKMYRPIGWPNGSISGSVSEPAMK
jgi:hypothetical protein